ncbi:MAG: T9SS type A sorting domain-containing protein [Sphingobacteriales bacterium JAD_PAG50586_3]|nr:MAG: T9SS type A sorting domain-containing protein [Sphingobacteriales bacterium JAD_PAG50586_3]
MQRLSPYYTITDADGFYTLGVPQAQNTYYISSIPINGELELTCPSPDNFRVVNIIDIDSVYSGNDFAYFGNDNGTSPCAVIQVSSVASVHRACCPGSRYIQICNEGSAPYTNGTLTLNYWDNFIVPTSASMPYTENGNSIVFNLPTIGIGQCIDVEVVEAVVDSTTIGGTACVEVVVGPPPACSLPNNLWDGSNLIVTGNCNVTTVEFTITNTGIGNMAQGEVYELYSENNLIDNGTVMLQAGQSQTLTYTATGNLLTMRVNQSDYNPNNSNPCSFVADCGPEMPPSQAYNLFTLGDEPDYVDVDCSPIVNSYDPNDKSATPIGVGPQHFVSSTDEIQYKIRFQNLGNGAANKVVIVDTLHANLDPATLQLGASSHPYAAELVGSNVLKFTFNNIELPPASVDEAGSMGVVTYSIKQRWGLPVNYYFENRAHIYFDLNPAIITNTVFHNVKENTTGITESTAGNILAELYPNPAGNSFTIRLDALKVGQGYNMQLFTSTGALVRDIANIKEAENIVDVSNLATGLYYYRILTTDGKTAAGRFVKE